MLSAAALPHAVLFDLDGTLLDTAPDLCHAANAMLRDLGRAPVTLEDIRAWVGRGIPNLVKRVLAADAVAAEEPAPPPEAALASFRRHYASCNGNETSLFPGVAEGLAAFKSRGLPLAVITNKAHEFVMTLLARTGIGDYFDVVVGGGLLPRAKPDPMPVVWACGRLNVAPHDALLIGDSVHDLAAGHAAGCRVFLVPYGYNEGRNVADLPRNACDAIVASVFDAYAAIYSS